MSAPIITVDRSGGPDDVCVMFATPHESGTGYSIDQLLHGEDARKVLRVLDAATELREAIIALRASGDDELLNAVGREALEGAWRWANALVIARRDA